MSALTKLYMHLDRTFPYSPYYFSIWRMLFGMFLTFYSIAVLPYAVILYSEEGIYTTYSVLPFFPNILGVYDGVIMVYVLCGIAIVSSFCIMIGYKRQWCAFFLWFVTMCFFGRNILTEDPSMGFVAMLLVLMTLVPSGEPFSFSSPDQKRQWYMPYFVYMTMLLTIGIGYSISGFDKLGGHGWQAGDAMLFLYNLEVAYDTFFVDMLRQSPMWSIQLQTWAAALAMLFALPLLIASRSRPFMWLVLMGMYTLILFVLNIKQVIFGVLLSHLFIFDNRWIPRKKAETVELFYDTRCNLCRAYKQFIETEDVASVTTFSSITNVTLPQGVPETFVLVVDGNTFYRSDAFLEHMALLGGIWRVVGILGKALPRKIRNALYDHVAKHRYIYFGTCDSEGCSP